MSSEPTTLAVVTRHGALVHLADPAARRHARTVCGVEWIGLHTPNVAPEAATCSRCVPARRSPEEPT